ncbi:addiction module toxin RelE [Serratia sp. L9]|uniref:addiction module toxin RelE n=1 Tax=Serratia sp. L9 TaxID=3423946 RepID=UPI003D66839A
MPPQAGHPMEQRLLQFRQSPVAFGHSGYLVRYHFYGTTVVIVAVRHQFEAGY